MKSNTQELLRKRFTNYVDNNPVKLTEVGKIIGIEKSQRYKVTRFLSGMYTLADSNKEMLENFLSVRGY